MPFSIGFFMMKERRKLTDQELHNLAMNTVGRQLEASGYEFMTINSKPKKNPQFVCLFMETRGVL